MEQVNFPKIIIVISAIVFLLLGIAVVFIEYSFSIDNVMSKISATTLAFLCGTIFLLIFLFILNKKYHIIGNPPKKNDKEN